MCVFDRGSEQTLGLVLTKFAHRFLTAKSRASSLMGKITSTISLLTPSDSNYKEMLFYFELNI